MYLGRKSLIAGEASEWNGAGMCRGECRRLRVGLGSQERRFDREANNSGEG